MSSNTHELSAQWSFSQTIGDDNGDQDKEQDYISAVAFSPNGAYVAVGNRSGKIWIHQERQDKQIGVKRHYEHYTYFQSHKHDIDYLKSQYIAEKINMIRWCPNVHKSQMLLSTNDKTIKLWKMFTHFMHNSTNLHSGFISDISQVRIPQLTDVDSVPACSLKCSFANAHIYHINSISLCTDHETFISSDDLRINMWNLTVPNISFNMVDLRPDNMDDLTEVITSAHFHPIHCHQLLFSSSRGLIRIMDMREKALLSAPGILLESDTDPSTRSFFSEIISSISDATYSPDGRFVASRDYLSVRIWDIHYPKRPLHVLPVHDAIKSCLSEVYENDSIFDKFEICASSTCSRRVVTGSYNNEAIIYNWDDHSVEKIAPVPTVDQNQAFSSFEVQSYDSTMMRRPDLVPQPSAAIDFDRKCLHVSWHPTDDVIAVASKTDLNIFQRR